MTDQNNGSIAAEDQESAAVHLGRAEAALADLAAEYGVDVGVNAPGHNSGGFSVVLLGSLIERVERLEEEKRTIAADIKEIYAEAKGDGFDTKIMRQLIKERRMDKDDLDEQEALLDTYRRALGMLATTPLGEAALAGVAG